MEEAMNPSSTSSTSSDINGFFAAEDLKDLLGWKLQTGLLDITCGCTSTMGYGDFVASLRITQQGELSVHCNCLPGSCNEGTMTPIKFERHALNDRRKWKESIWVTMFHGSCKYSQKVPLCNTVLLRYYKASRNNGKSMRHVNVHRDEFLRCSACGKERRFKIRNSHEFLVYSLAQKNPNWMCGDEFNCEMEEERASRKMLRGCPKLINCEGCLSCVCTGCDMCLFA